MQSLASFRTLNRLASVVWKMPAPTQHVRYLAIGSKTKKDNKKGNSKKPKGKDENRKKSDAIHKFLEFAEDAKKIKLDFTEEELAKNKEIAREYQRQCFKFEAEMQKDLSNKVWLQQEALRAMPEQLRSHALIIDDTPPPDDRPWPQFDTPAIKGFNPLDFEEKNSENGL